MVFPKRWYVQAFQSAARARLLPGMIAWVCAFGALGSTCWVAQARAVPAQSESANVNGQMIQYTSNGTNIPAYLAKPAGSGKHAAVIVVHDVAGLDNNMEGVVRQFAAEGFVSLAPNLLSRSSGPTPFTEIQKLTLTQPLNDLKAAFAFLQQDPSVDSTKISVVGFGWGGWRAFKLAEDTPNLYRVVVYYGTTPTDNLSKIHAPVLAHYAQFDFRNTGNAIITADELGKNFKYYVYHGTDRGFVTTSGPYAPQDVDANAAASKLAWTRTLQFLKS